MMSKLNKINEQLDDLLVKQLELAQDYINVTIEGESHQKSGFLNLAKARYIQGFHSVSKNCLFSEDSEEERPPVVTVSREESLFDKDSEGNHANIVYQKPSLLISTDKAIDVQLNKQFGFLSSGTLKHAKNDFRNCLEKTIERAIIVAQLKAVQAMYGNLLAEKSNLENDEPTA